MASSADHRARSAGAGSKPVATRSMKHSSRFVISYEAPMVREVSLWCRPDRSPRSRRPGGGDTGRPRLHAARFDPAGFCLADDLQLGSFRRAAEVTRNTGDGLARGSHGIFATASITGSIPVRGQSPGTADPAPGAPLLCRSHHKAGSRQICSDIIMALTRKRATERDDPDVLRPGEMGRLARRRTEIALAVHS